MIHSSAGKAALITLAQDSVETIYSTSRVDEVHLPEPAGGNKVIKLWVLLLRFCLPDVQWLLLLTGQLYILRFRPLVIELEPFPSLSFVVPEFRQNGRNLLRRTTLNEGIRYTY